VEEPVGHGDSTENSEEPYSAIIFFLYFPLFAFSSLDLPLLERLQKGGWAEFLRDGAGLAGGY
jgi:hypothetical protein